MTLVKTLQIIVSSPRKRGSIGITKEDFSKNQWFDWGQLVFGEVDTRGGRWIPAFAGMTFDFEEDFSKNQWFDWGQLVFGEVDTRGSRWISAFAGMTFDF